MAGLAISHKKAHKGVLFVPLWALECGYFTTYFLLL